MFYFVNLNPYDPFDPQVFTSVVLPDSSQYTIKYNSYSEVTTVSLPTNGGIQLSYAQGPAPVGGNIIRYITERKTLNTGGTLDSDTLYGYSGHAELTGHVERDVTYTYDSGTVPNGLTPDPPEPSRHRPATERKLSQCELFPSIPPFCFLPAP